MATEGARLRVGQGGGSGKKLGSCLVRSDSCVASGLSGRFGAHGYGACRSKRILRGWMPARKCQRSPPDQQISVGSVEG